MIKQAPNNDDIKRIHLLEAKGNDAKEIGLLLCIKEVGVQGHMKPKAKPKSKKK